MSPAYIWTPSQFIPSFTNIFKLVSVLEWGDELARA
jgi:hypothetical protein